MWGGEVVGQVSPSLTGDLPLHHTGSLNQAPHRGSHFPRRSHDLLIADPQIRLLTADGVDALEAPLHVVAGLLQGACVVSVLTLVDV